MQFQDFEMFNKRCQACDFRSRSGAPGCSEGGLPPNLRLCLPQVGGGAFVRTTVGKEGRVGALL